jgi:hypothetical protein
MFRSFAQSWDFTVASLRILWSNKRLIVFPLASLLSTALLVASFVVPLVMGGQLAEWGRAIHNHRGLPHDPMPYLLLFLFYYLNYFSLKLPLLLVLLPIYLLGIGVAVLGVRSGNHGIAGGAIAACVALFVLGISIGQAAETTFNALLYNFANDRDLPDFIEPAALGEAFVTK